MNVEHHLFNRERNNKMKAAVFVEPGKMEVREVARLDAICRTRRSATYRRHQYRWLLDGQLGNGWWTCFLHHLWQRSLAKSSFRWSNSILGKRSLNLTHWTILTKPTKTWLTEKRLKPWLWWIKSSERGWYNPASFMIVNVSSIVLKYLHFW